MIFLAKIQHRPLNYSLYGLLIRLLLASLFVVPALASAQSSDLFPRPSELEPAVNFWIKVYTEVNTRNGFLHDSQNLSVIYARVSNNRREREAQRNEIRENLQLLASGKRDDLTPSQSEILTLWPEDVSNQTLRTAASNIRFQLGQSDRFMGGLKRSGAYRAHINQVIREKNLPIGLGVLPHVESSFNPRAYSSASAAGMWQFGRATGQRFMRIDHIVDERMDPYIATYAAMSLLEYNYSVLGTWPLALTAYNHGVGGISRAVRQIGTTDIEKIVVNYRGRAFGFASRNFYAQFLAVMHVDNNAQQYFGDLQLNPAPNFLEVETDAYIDAEIFASAIGVSLEQLRADNPALRPAVWEGNKRIPVNFPLWVRMEAVTSGDLLALVPEDFKFSMQTPDIAYVVERGDSLSVIARRFDTSVSRLAALNQLSNRHRIQIGQRLLLPQDSLDDQQLASNVKPSAPSDGVYTVRRGDTVSLIAARYGITEQSLLGNNGIQDRDRIYPGQQLTLPGFEPEHDQFVVIESSLTPTLPSREQVAGEIDEAVVLIDEVSVGDVENTVQETREEPPVQLALNEELLPPAAVLPDNQVLDTTVTPEEEQAVAIDPALDLAESNEQLTEALAADPSDYTVASNNTVEIHASETLGHYADWLGIRAWDIRRLNNMAFRDPVIIGKRLKLDFSRVNIAEFELKRRDFHSSLQQEFFSSYRIQDVEQYRVTSGDNIGRIARNRYSTPIWLLRQYNPELDFNRIQIGQVMVFPLLEQVN